MKNRIQLVLFTAWKLFLAELLVVSLVSLVLYAPIVAVLVYILHATVHVVPALAIASCVMILALITFFVENALGTYDDASNNSNLQKYVVPKNMFSRISNEIRSGFGFIVIIILFGMIMILMHLTENIDCSMDSDTVSSRNFDDTAPVFIVGMIGLLIFYFGVTQFIAVHHAWALTWTLLSIPIIVSAGAHLLILSKKADTPGCIY